MTDLPTFALHASDVATSVAFYTEKLGFTLLEQRPEEDIAYLRDSDGDPLLLAGPAVQNLPSYLNERSFILEPGGSLGFQGEDLEAQQADLRSKGVTDLQLVQRRTGDRILRVKTPDNYSFDFIQRASHTIPELLALYARSLDELDEALAGLSEADMGLTLYEGGWNIRQIVHHIADTDILFGESMKVALSASGTKMNRAESVGNDKISTEPEYRDRPVATSVALFRAFHTHILDIVKYVPNAGERYIENSQGNKSTFSQMANLIVGHVAEHVDEIWEIRRKHER